MMPPFYSLGFFTGSNSYKTSAQMVDVVNSYLNDGIPIEGVFLETYMKDNQAFTVDTDRFSDIKKLT